MRLQVIHTTRMTYSAVVAEEVMECRLGPLADDDQRWERFELRAQPGGHIRSYVDGFGNNVYLVTVVPTHEFLELTTRSEVITQLDDPFALPARLPRPLTPAERYDYLSPSRLVLNDPRLPELASGHQSTAKSDPFAATLELSSLIHRQFRFITDTTSTTTTVAEVLDVQAGVCQDFSHVLLGLCRTLGIPARYVSGYVIRGEGENASAVSSHAWVEAYSPSHGWRGFDPTNNVVASEHHVKMAVGRDYADVPPTRGTYRGGATADLAVDVTVRSIE